jgi:hypothetical protein
MVLRSEIECLTRFEKKHDNGFLENPIVCFAPEYTVRKPEEAKR